MIKGVSLSVTGKVGTLMKIKHLTNGQCSAKHMDQMFAESSRLDVFIFLGNARCIFYHTNLVLCVITARIRRMGKAMFSVCSPRGGGGGDRGVPQSQFLSKVSGPRPFPGGEHLLRGGRYASCGFPQDFLVLYLSKITQFFMN